MTDVEFTDNSEEVLSAFEKAIEKASTEIGMTAESYAKVLTPVDTGRLRNSITYATKHHSGLSHSYSDNNRQHFTQEVGNVEKNDVYIGTNVEYAPFQETKVHFLKHAAADHTDEYKAFLKEAMENT